MRSHVTLQKFVQNISVFCCFNTANGMRSHVTPKQVRGSNSTSTFQYRKRYEITCDAGRRVHLHGRAHSFNTASGMRSHVTWLARRKKEDFFLFQYRKRYEITCDTGRGRYGNNYSVLFQYRKRYEITCDHVSTDLIQVSYLFQYRKRYEITCDELRAARAASKDASFNTASGMRSHVT